MPYIDTHTHLDQAEFDADRAAVLQRAREAGVETLIGIGISADSSQASIAMAEQHGAVFAAVGIQPNYCAEAASHDWDRILAFADHPRAVAIGETGLDRHWDFTPLDQQRDYFDRHLRLAQQRDLPVVIHCREAEADVLSMLHEALARAPLRGVMHAFGGDEDFAAECLACGLFVSFAGNVTYRNKKFDRLRSAAHIVPDDRLLIETDSPYLVPHPLRGKLNRNEPANLVLTAQSLAELRGVTVEQVGAQTTANARRLFAFVS